MAFARARAARTLRAALRPATRSHQLPRLTAQRRWQSGGHGGEHAASSDIPWLIGAIAVTVPGAWWLWPAPHSADAHGHGHEEHAEHDEESEEKEGKEEGGDQEEQDAQEDSAPAEQADKEEKPKKEEGDEDKKEGGEEDKKAGKKGGDDKGEEKKEEDGDEKAEKKDKKKDDGDKKDDKKEDGGDDSGDDKKEESSSDDSKDEQPEGDDSKKSTFASNPSGKDAPQFKGKMKPDAEGQSDSRKSEPMPASKGGNKKRIDSGYQKDLGSAAGPSDGSTSDGSQEGKQKGLSNTASRHSIPIHEDPSKSKKSEGVPDTAKITGTVDSSRPAK